MGQRQVHNSHRWGQDQRCRGCGCEMRSPKAEQPCKGKYAPKPRVYPTDGER